jgi:PIN domain nuclease of toxin-antitoxin system
VKRVIDASAVLAVCNQEPGGIEARSKMRGGLISTVNLSEVFQKSLKLNKLPLARAIVQTAGLRIVPFEESHALVSAELAFKMPRKKDVSFADRACLALGIVESLPILTGDRVWSELGLDAQIELFRPELN